MSHAAETKEHAVPLPDSDQPVEAAEIVRHLAHELRQPLSTIESIAYYLDLVLPPEAPKARQQIDKLQQLVEQTNWIVSNAVHYVQAARPAPQRIDLELLLDQIGAELTAEGFPVELEFSGIFPPLRMDAIQAHHVLHNLFASYRTLASSGPVRVTAVREGGMVRLDSSSPASGYSAESLAALFEPFHTGLPSGAGLSMASLRSIVDAQGGRVEVTSGPESVGISLTMPAW